MEKASPLKCGYLRYVAIKFQGCRCIHFSILFHQEMAELAAKAEAKAGGGGTATSALYAQMRGRGMSLLPWTTGTY